MTPIEKRHQATMLTVTKYLRRNFAWGSCDCGKIAAFHARKFGWKVPKSGTYKSAAGAVRYLKSLDCENMAGLLDKIGFPVIASAHAMMGDFLGLPSADGLGGIGIFVGGGKVMAFHEDHATPVMIAIDWAAVERAWSIWSGSAVEAKWIAEQQARAAQFDEAAHV